MKLTINKKDFNFQSIGSTFELTPGFYILEGLNSVDSLETRSGVHLIEITSVCSKSFDYKLYEKFDLEKVVLDRQVQHISNSWNLFYKLAKIEISTNTVITQVPINLKQSLNNSLVSTSFVTTGDRGSLKLEFETVVTKEMLDTEVSFCGGSFKNDFWNVLDEASEYIGKSETLANPDSVVHYLHNVVTLQIIGKKEVILYFPIQCKNEIMYLVWSFCDFFERLNLRE